jgi:hypothetical protein
VSQAIEYCIIFITEGCQAREADSSVGQSFMAMLMAFSWRFLLILAPDRARRVSWGVASNPADLALELGSAMSDTDMEADENSLFSGEMPSNILTLCII